MSQFHSYNQGGPGGHGGNPGYSYGGPGGVSGGSGAGGMGGGPGAQGGPEMFNIQGVSPEMLTYGMSIGNDLLKKQKDKWMPGVSGFWNNLKIYFAVDHNYVTKKMTILLYPMANHNWVRLPADEINASTHKWALPREDYNSPDLYIPLMSFVTYVLLVGLSRGVGGHDFSPDILVQAVWRCLMLQLFETVVIKFGLGLINVPIPFLDIFSYTGYKYVFLCINAVAGLFGRTFSALISLYGSTMVAYFVLKCMANVVAPESHSGGPPRHLVLLGFAALQFVVVFVLCWL